MYFTASGPHWCRQWRFAALNQAGKPDTPNSRLGIMAGLQILRIGVDLLVPFPDVWTHKHTEVTRQTDRQTERERERQTVQTLRHSVGTDCPIQNGKQSPLTETPTSPRPKP